MLHFCSVLCEGSRGFPQFRSTEEEEEEERWRKSLWRQEGEGEGETRFASYCSVKDEPRSIDRVDGDVDLTKSIIEKSQKEKF